MQTAFISVRPIRDVYTAETRRDRLLSLVLFLFLFCLDYGFPPASLKQFRPSTKPSPSYHFYRLPCELGAYGYQFLGFRPSWGLESKCCVALFAFPFTPLSCPRRGFCCCISAFLLCMQEAREQNPPNALIRVAHRLKQTRGPNTGGGDV